MGQTSGHFSKQATIESLEKRQLLSASVSLAFAGKLPISFPPTGTTRVALRVTDAGTSAINGPETIQLFASTDSTLDESDVPLTTAVKMVRLKPRQNATEILTVQSPMPLADGGYFLIAEVDGYPSVAVSAKPVQYANPFSDVAVQFENLPATPVEIDGPSAGRQSVAVDVVNTGNVAVHGPVNLNFYLSSDAVLDANDPLLSAVLTKPLSLKPGQHKAVSFRVGVPANTAIGGYFLFATMSPAAVLNDSNAGNNTAMSSSRLAVVNRLPLPPQTHHHDGDYGYGGSFDGPVDDGGYVYSGDDGSDSSGAPGDDGSDSSSVPVDTGSSGQSDSAPTDNGSSDSTPTDNGSSDSTPSDGGSSDSSGDNSSAPDTWDDGSDSSSGDF